MRDFNVFVENIRKILQNRLPGPDAQMLMAPASRREQVKLQGENMEAIPSGVLVLFYPDEGQIHIPFIKRPEYDGVHSGQIAFPGGKYEKEDKTLQTTALREANEEVGILPENVHVIGNLTSLFIPPSRFSVLPVVGYSKKKPEFVPDKSEVDHIIHISIDELLDVNSLTEKEILLRAEVKLKVPCLFIQGHIIWGATAMMLSELIEIIKKADRLS